jgi:hypothetical protein
MNWLVSPPEMTGYKGSRVRQVRILMGRAFGGKFLFFPLTKAAGFFLLSRPFGSSSGP